MELETGKCPVLAVGNDIGSCLRLVLHGSYVRHFPNWLTIIRLSPRRLFAHIDLLNPITVSIRITKYIRVNLLQNQHSLLRGCTLSQLHQDRNHNRFQPDENRHDGEQANVEFAVGSVWVY